MMVFKEGNEGKKTIKQGDWVEIPTRPACLPLIGRVVSVWGEWAKVCLRIGGSRKMISYRLDELKSLKDDKEA